jgi:glycerol dehydrogenase-like iron-containing ADH family enzyme
MENYKMNYTVVLPSYSVGTEAYHAVPTVTRRYGKKAVVVGGKTAMSKAKDALLDALKGTGVEVLDFVWYGGNSTYENAEKLKNHPAVQQADMVFAMGGGRAIDTCKVFCDELDKPLFSFPTIASNCAPCTAISVMYNADDTFRDYYYPKTCPIHTFINTQVIAEAPESLLWAGIGDALSKEYEVLLATRKADLFHTTLMGAQLSRSCTDPLVDFGAQALADCRAHKASYALQQVALDIIISTGLVSNMTSGGDDYYYNSSLAHCFYYGSTMVPKAAAHHLHGEIVSYGVLCLLAYDGQTAELERIMKFNKSIGLPVTLAEMDLTPEDLPVMVEKAKTVLEWTCTPYTMDGDKYTQAILAVDKAGQAMQG